MSDHDEGRHLVVGGGAPADPDPLADDLLQAVVDFVRDLIDAPGNGTVGDGAAGDGGIPAPDGNNGNDGTGAGTGDGDVEVGEAATADGEGV